MSNGDTTASDTNLGDLISDFAITEAGDDKFGHTAIVDQIESIVRTRDKEHALNVALYGPWGSGKSSVAKQLEARFADDEKIAFICFDAFKYSQGPLHRHFLARIAEALPAAKEASKWRHWRPKSWTKWQPDYRDRLYQSTQRKALNLSVRDGARLLWNLFWFVLVPTIALALAGSVIWAEVLSTGSDASYKEALPRVLTLLVVPAAAAAFAVVRELVPVSTSMAEPSSAEQFESMFEDIVKASGKDRVVVFVDEIDRCSPDEVVATLDTVRTFLGVPPCVFIVAADQHVLEQAISLRVRQTTPDNATNPYYSAGSAYLDKVFQYQFSVPPLLPATVSRYALDLVKPLPGVWRQVNAEDVISLLIATHVRSPRRVKALLNNYVLTHRLAQSAGLLGPGSKAGPGRDEELAVLVCLQSEFPRFYRDLAQHPRLPLLLRSLRDQAATLEDPKDEEQIAGLEPPAGTSSASWSLAVAYHLGRVVGDEILVREEGASGAARGVVAAGRLNDELIDYLQKTSDVPGPGTDLIFMIDAAGFFGLDPTEAEELAADAVNKNREAVLERVAGYEPDLQQAVLRLLSHRTREVAFGTEGANMASTLLAVAGVYLTAPGQTADEVARAIAAQQAKRSLMDDDMPGALRVGLLSQTTEAGGLVAKVLDAAGHRRLPEITTAILESAGRLRKLGQGPAVADAWAWGISQELVPVGALIGALVDDESPSLPRQARDTLADVIQAAETGEHASETLDPEVDRKVLLRERIGAVLAALVDANEMDAAEQVLCALCRDDNDPLVEIARTWVEIVGPARSEELADVLRDACSLRPLRELPIWFVAAHGPGLTSDKQEELHESVLRRLWASRDSEDPEFEAALDALSLDPPMR